MGTGFRVRASGARRRAVGIIPSALRGLPPDQAEVLATIGRAVDREFYLTMNPDVVRAGREAVEHYATHGWQEERDPAPWFSTRAYLAAHPVLVRRGINPLYHFLTRGRLQRAYPLDSSWADQERLLLYVRQGLDASYYGTVNPDVVERGVDPVEHYAHTGWREGRDPAPWFSTAYYLDRNRDVADAAINPLYHFLTVGRFEGRLPLPLTMAESDTERLLAVLRSAFDEQYYLETNPDIAAVQTDPVLHYAFTGWREGRRPVRDFDPTAYRRAHGLPADIDPFLHFCVAGRFLDSPVAEVVIDLREPRHGAPELSCGSVARTIADSFDPAHYLTAYPDVAAAGLDPVLHYVETGWREFRDPSPDFHTRYYVETNPDVATAGINPLYHYVVTGQREGRRPQPPGGDRGRVLYDLQPASGDGTTMLRLPVQRLERDELRTRWRAVSLRGARLVLAVGHDDYRHSVGGIQVCVAEEQAGFNARGDDYLLLAPAVAGLMLRTGDEATDPLQVIVNGESLGYATADVLADVVRDLRGDDGYHDVDLLIHALQGHSIPQLLRLLSALSVTSGHLWVHDYFTACAGYNLMRNAIEYCGAPAPTSNACGICVFGDRRDDHLRDVRSLFEQVDLTLLAPSATALATWQASTALPHRRSIVLEHRILGDDLGPLSPAAPESPVRVGFAGHPHLHKGWSLYERLLALRPEGHDFHHFGVERVERPGLTFVEVRTTRDDLEAMSRTLYEHGTEVLVMASTWPETFSLMAYEAIAAGAFLVTTRASGNIAAVVADMKCGIVCDDDEDVVRRFLSGEVAQRAREYRRSARRRELGTSQLSVDVISGVCHV